MARTVAALKICARIMARHDVARCAASPPRPAGARSTASSSSTGSGGSPASSSRSCRRSRRRSSRCWAACRWSTPTPSRCCWSTSAAAAPRCSGSTAARPAARLLRCVASVPIGVVSLSEAFTLGAGPADLRGDGAAACRACWRRSRRPWHRGRAPRRRAAQMLGTSGTVTTLAALLLGLPRYDRRLIDGLLLDPDAIARGLGAAARHGQRRARGASLHRAGSRRPGGRRLRDPRGGPAQLAGRPAAGRRPRPARGHAAGLMGRSLDAGARRPWSDRRRGRPAGRPGGAPATAREPCRAARRQGPRTLEQGAAHRLDPLARRVTSTTASCSSARKEGYRSRAAYKLLEIDQKFALLQPGRRVLDLGSAPGGWAAGRACGAAPRGRRRPRRRWRRSAGAALLQGDIFDEATLAAAARGRGRPGRGAAERPRRGLRPASAASIACAPRRSARPCWRCCRSCWRRAAAWSLKLLRGAEAGARRGGAPAVRARRV